MIKVGITGGIGSGKTTVCNVFRLLGVPLFNADMAGRSALNEIPEVIDKVKKNFGEHLYLDGSVDRKRLAGVVFSDEKKLALLNAIVHPVVIQQFEDWAAKFIRHAYVIKESALLFETGLQNSLDSVVSVIAPFEDRALRVMTRDKITRDEFIKRAVHQIDDQARLKKSDHVINNDAGHLIIPQVLDLHALFSKPLG